MKKDRLLIDKDDERLLDMLKEKDILGFHDSENKEIFTIAVALGHRDPKEIRSRNAGFVRAEYIKTADKAVLSSALLGLAENDSDLDKYADDDTCFEFAERCANHGFEILKNKTEEAGYDNELFERRMIKELDQLFTLNIENNI